VSGARRGGQRVGDGRVVGRSAHTANPQITVTFNTTNTWQGGGFQGQIPASPTTSRCRSTTGGSRSRSRAASSRCGTASCRAGPGTFTISAPSFNLTLDPGEVAIVGRDRACSAIRHSRRRVSRPAAGSPQVRALATPQAPCLGLSCPNGLRCSVGANGIPTCVP
jgi:hypothetical protein